MIRVLIADDSAVFQKVLKHFLSDEANIEIVGVVDNGIDAVEKCRELKPDLVTMDIFMPKMNGLEATRRIMAECPTRIVIISSMINTTNLQYSFEAMQAGAVEVIEKPSNTMSGNYEGVRAKLIAVLKQTMDAQPAKRFTWIVENAWGESSQMFRPSLRPSSAFSSTRNFEGTPSIEIAVLDDGGSEPPPSTISVDFVPSIICIGGSTGAPAVISDILRSLPEGFRIPIIIAQHIVKGFVSGMAEWLNSMSKLTVRTAVDNERPLPGYALFAPDNMHISLSDNRRIQLTPGGSDDLYIPSINILFHSVARTFGAKSLGIILTGMGKDGALGLQEMRRHGAATVAQNEETSVVYGMPKVASTMGAVMEEMSPADMAQFLIALSERAKEYDV